MKLKEVFDQLTYGELSQLSIGGGEAGVIDPSNYSKILAHINLGLLALYKRFPLKEGQLVLELKPGVTQYTLHSRHAYSGMSMSGVSRYILDSKSAPFKDDILKVEKVKGSSGFEFGLNNEADVYSVFTPTSTTLRIPAEIVGDILELPEEVVTNTLQVFYRASHPILAIDADWGLELDETELELPYSHLEPLLLFVASRAHTPMGMTNEFNAGNNYAAKYEQACQQLDIYNLRVDQNSQTSRLRSNGWV